MPNLTVRRMPVSRRIAAGVALAAILGACSAAASTTLPSVAPPNALPSGPAAPSLPAPTAKPGQAFEVDALLVAAAAMDGKAVRVTGFLLTDGRGAQLCTVSLDSYPPQCGGANVALSGTVPRATLDRLDHTSDPALAQAVWGWVVVTGTFHAGGAIGTSGPTVELGEVTLAEG